LGQAPQGVCHEGWWVQARCQKVVGF